MNTLAAKTLEQLFELYANAESGFVKDGIEREIQTRLASVFSQLEKCKTEEYIKSVYNSFLDI